VKFVRALLVAAAGAVATSSGAAPPHPDLAGLR